MVYPMTAVVPRGVKGTQDHDPFPCSTYGGDLEARLYRAWSSSVQVVVRASVAFAYYPACVRSYILNSCLLSQLRDFLPFPTIDGPLQHDPTIERAVAPLHLSAGAQSLQWYVESPAVTCGRI